MTLIYTFLYSPHLFIRNIIKSYSSIFYYLRLIKTLNIFFVCLHCVSMLMSAFERITVHQYINIIININLQNRKHIWSIFYFLLFGWIWFSSTIDNWVWAYFSIEKMNNFSKGMLAFWFSKQLVLSFLLNHNSRELKSLERRENS